MRLAKWPLQLKPRERMEREGAHALSDVELIAILLRVGNRERNVVELAQALLFACDGELSQLHRIPFTELDRLGVGKVQRILLQALHEIGMRMQRQVLEPLTLEQGIAWTQERMAALTHEVFFVLPLDARERLIGFPIEVSRGTRYQVLVEPREVIAAVLKRGAKAFVIMHNHPSGEAEPSSQDILLTKQLIEGAQWMGIELKDHCIVTQNKNPFSFLEEGLLED